MIRLIRKKLGISILELRYPKELVSEKGYNVIKLYSFKDLKEESWEKNPTCTMQIDLSLSKEDLWSSLKKNYRKHIHTEELREIEIKKASESKEFNNFYKKLYIPLCKKKKLKPYPKEYLKQGDLWITKKGLEMLSGSIIFTDKQYATQSFNASKHIEYNGNRKAIWEAIKYYKSQGLKYFNFGGGESDYKRRFGANKVDVWIYTKYLSKKAKVLKRFRNILIR